jgi:hypothetical protein
LYPLRTSRADCRIESLRRDFPTLSRYFLLLLLRFVHISTARVNTNAQG